jgi:hypothetical protein
MDLDVSWSWRADRLPPEVKAEVEKRLNELHQFFPEMKPKLKIGITRIYDGLAFQSNSGNVKLRLEVKKTRKNGWKYPTYWTIAHEFMHLAQFNSKGIPGGERACDVYTLSRLPPRYIDDSPSYLVVPPENRDTWSVEDARLAHDLAKEALIRRKKGLRNYAAWWEDELERRLEARAEAR